MMHAETKALKSSVRIIEGDVDSEERNYIAVLVLYKIGISCPPIIRNGMIPRV